MPHDEQADHKVREVCQHRIDDDCAIIVLPGDEDSRNDQDRNQGITLGNEMRDSPVGFEQVQPASHDHRQRVGDDDGRKIILFQFTFQPGDRKHYEQDYVNNDIVNGLESCDSCLDQADIVIDPKCDEIDQSDE